MRRPLVLLLSIALASLALAAPSFAADNLIFAGHVTTVQLSSTTLAPDGTVSTNSALNDQYTQAYQGSYLSVPGDGFATWERLDPPNAPILIAPPSEWYGIGLTVPDYLLVGISRDATKFISFTATLSLMSSQSNLAYSFLHIVEQDVNGNLNFTDGYLTLEAQ
jgi:hypothetical protein